MKEKHVSGRETKPADEQKILVDPRIAVRLDLPVAERFLRVVAASKRTKTSIVEECINEVLPRLEKQYSKAA